MLHTGESCCLSRWTKSCGNADGDLSARKTNVATQLGDFGGDFLYFFFLSMPFNMMVSGFLQPGESLTGYGDEILGNNTAVGGSKRTLFHRDVSLRKPLTFLVLFAHVCSLPSLSFCSRLLVVWTDTSYEGAGYWRTSLANFDMLINMLFYIGCVVQFCLVCVICDLCYVCAYSGR